MANDQSIDSGTTQGDQSVDSGNQNAQPLTINADVLGDLRDDPVFKPFDGKPVSEVFKSFKNAQSLIGGEKIVLPNGKLDTPENWNYVFDKLGRPKNPDGYQFEKPNLPEGLPYDENMEKAFKATVHQLGLLPKQAQGLYAFWNKIQADGYNAYVAAENTKAEATEAKLMQELGTQEKYKEYVAGATAALNRFGGAPDEVAAFIDKFGTDPLVIKVFGNVAKNMMEDAALRGDKSFNLLGEDAAGLAKDIMSNKENKLYLAYHDRSHPQHQHAVDEVSRLMTAVHGSKSVNMG